MRGKFSLGREPALKISTPPSRRGRMHQNPPS
jgi:hypothetical protein